MIFIYQRVAGALVCNNKIARAIETASVTLEWSEKSANKQFSEQNIHSEAAC